MWHRCKKWEAVAVYHYMDTSFGQGAASTSVTLRCRNCGKLKVDNLYASGHLSVEDLRRPDLSRVLARQLIEMRNEGLGTGNSEEFNHILDELLARMNEGSA